MHEQAVRLLFPIASSLDLGDIPTGIRTSLGLSTALLTEWAQTGGNGEQWDSGMALDAVQAVCEALYSCAGEPETFGVGSLDAVRDSDPDTAIGVLLRGAWPGSSSRRAKG